MQNNSKPELAEQQLAVPQPPDQIEVTDVQEAVENNQNRNVAVTIPENANGIPDKVQDMDWNNGRPEVSPEHVDPLPAHQTAEVANNEALRENKGNDSDEQPFEASEEVNTGQSAG